jgi:hypothetical protein
MSVTSTRPSLDTLSDDALSALSEYLTDGEIIVTLSQLSKLTVTHKFVYAKQGDRITPLKVAKDNAANRS